MPGKKEVYVAPDGVVQYPAEDLAFFGFSALENYLTDMRVNIKMG